MFVWMRARCAKAIACSFVWGISDDLLLRKPRISMRRFIHSIREVCDCAVDTMVRLGKSKADQMKTKQSTSLDSITASSLCST